MEKCKYCGTEFKENKNIPKYIPQSLKDLLKYIPSCDCEDKMRKEREKEAEKEIQKQRLMNKVKKFKDISIVDEKFLLSSFENAKKTKHIEISKKYAKRFVESHKVDGGLLFTGDVGTGKTYASACISNYLMENGKTVLVMSLGLYLLKIKREWAEAENDVLNYVKTCDLLVIDDLGAENISEFVKEKVFNLVDTRYRACKPMIITTNLNIDGIFSVFGKRIGDRISEMCLEISVIGESERKFDKKAFGEWLLG